jgi:hypothetical protein
MGEPTAECNNWLEEIGNRSMQTYQQSSQRWDQPEDVQKHSLKENLSKKNLQFTRMAIENNILSLALGYGPI